MGLRVGIEATALNEPGIWAAKIEPSELRHFGRPLATQGHKTVIGIIAPEYRDGSLLFSPSDAMLLNAGSSVEALLISLESEGSELSDGQSVIRIDGDNGFRASANALLNPDMCGSAHALLDALRDEFTGELVVGQGRKWVNSPANFVAFTIQNRDQSLAVTVRGEPDRHPNTPLALRRDRPGYSRFKVASSRDIGPAMAHIRRAANLYNGGRGIEPLER